MRRVRRALIATGFLASVTSCGGSSESGADASGVGNVQITIDPTGFADGVMGIQLEPVGRITIRGVRALPNGKLLLFGHAGLSEGVDAQAGRELDVFIRLASDGRADPTFGDEGIVLLDDRNGIEDLLVRPDGRLVVLGSHEYAVGLRVTQVWQLGSDGDMDTSFGVDGVARLDVSDLVGQFVTTRTLGAALAPDGALIVIGSPYRDGEPGEALNFAARITSAGEIEERVLVPQAQNGRDDLWSSVVVDPDGTTRVYGDSWDGAAHCMAGQLTSSLEIDPTFAGGDYAKIAAVESDCRGTTSRRPDGRVVVAGASGGLSMFDIAGNLDATFGTGGYVDLEDYVSATETLTNGTMLAQMQVPLDQSPFSATYVIRIAADGTVDAGFGESVGVGPFAAGMAITTTGDAFAAEMEIDRGTVHLRALPVP